MNDALSRNKLFPFERNAKRTCICPKDNLKKKENDILTTKFDNFLFQPEATSSK